MLMFVFQVFIDRFRYNANRAAQVQSKLKLLEKLWVWVYLTLTWTDTHLRAAGRTVSHKEGRVCCWLWVCHPEGGGGGGGGQDAGEQGLSASTKLRTSLRATSATDSFNLQPTLTCSLNHCHCKHNCTSIPQYFILFHNYLSILFWLYLNVPAAMMT